MQQYYMAVSWIYVIGGIFYVLRVAYCAPVKINDTTVSSLTSKSLVINFTELSDVDLYHVTLKERHSSTEFLRTIVSSGDTISGLSPDTIYQVTIKGEDTDGTNGPESDPVFTHTYPGAPTITASNQLPDSTFVFFNLNNYARVSEWTIEYREFGSTDTQTVTTIPGEYYSYWLSGLFADTTYQIRARASKIKGIPMTESEVEFSSWQNFTTAPYSVFGRVVLTNQTLAGGESVAEGSSAWNYSLSRIQDAYLSIQHNGISLLTLEKEDDNPLAFYEIKVKDKTLPSKTNFTLSGSGFNNSFINNGDTTTGKPFLNHVVMGTDPEIDAYNSAYILNESVCVGEKINARQMFVRPEKSSTLKLELVTKSSDGVTSVEEDVLFNIKERETLIVLENNAGIIGTVPLNTVLGLAPSYLIRDCLKNQLDVSLYTRYFSAFNVAREKVNPFFFTTAFSSASIPVNKTTYTSSSDGTAITLNIPAVGKAIKYEILNDSDNVVGAVEEADIDGSDFLKIQVSSLTDGMEYTFKLRVEVRKQDGSFSIAVSTDTINITTNSEMCSSCDSNATCTSDLTGLITCSCSAGFSGDGTTCTPVTTTTTEPRTTQPSTTANSETTTDINTAISSSPTSEDPTTEKSTPSVTSEASSTSLMTSAQVTSEDPTTKITTAIMTSEASSTSLVTSGPMTSEIPKIEETATSMTAKASSTSLMTSALVTNEDPTTEETATSITSETSATPSMSSSSELSTMSQTFSITKTSPRVSAGVTSPITLVYDTSAEMTSSPMTSTTSETDSTLRETVKTSMTSSLATASPIETTPVTLFSGSSSTDSWKDFWEWWIILLVVLGAILLISGLILIFICCCLRRKWKAELRIGGAIAAKRRMKMERYRCCCCPWVETLLINESGFDSATTREASRVGMNNGNRRSSCCPWEQNLRINRMNLSEVDGGENPSDPEYMNVRNPSCCPCWADTLWVNRGGMNEEDGARGSFGPNHPDRQSSFCCPWISTLWINKNSRTRSATDRKTNVTDSPELGHGRSSCCPWMARLWINGDRPTHSSSADKEQENADPYAMADDERHVCCPWAANLWINRHPAEVYEENDETNQKRSLCCPWSKIFVVNRRPSRGVATNNTNGSAANTQNGIGHIYENVHMECEGGEIELSEL